MFSDHNHFETQVLNYYQQHNRHLLWRQPDSKCSFDPYKIMVSEVMLQQTQVSRVTDKFKQFLQVFPDTTTLAAANLSDVLLLWSGLGYNRRAKYLHQAAQMIVTKFNGNFPAEVSTIQLLPGIGYNTAAAIATYAFNQKHIFIETNVRTVYIYHFFAHETAVSDAMLEPHIAESLDRIARLSISYREWYWALMDYGTFIKKSVGNVGQQSKHYQKQSNFEGSRRQVRGNLIKALLDGPKTVEAVKELNSDKRFDSVLADLVSEGFVILEGNSIRLA